MLIRNRLREVRTLRGMAAAELARQAGISRQTVYAIEDGSFVPNTTVALQMARALQVSVEELFALTGEEKDSVIEVDLLEGSQPVTRGQATTLCRVGNRLVAVPVPVFPAYLPAADGVIESAKTKRSAVIRSATVLPDDGRRLLLAGCDPALSLLNESLHGSGIQIVSAPCPSRRALDWLRKGNVHVAGSHLLDRASGVYNLPIIQRLFPSEKIRVVTFAEWQQGLVVERGNPKGIRSLADIGRKGVKTINRAQGSGSRDLLDIGLRKFGIATSEVDGYDSIADGHLAATYAVATGSADCCIAAESAAWRFGLDFVPLAAERFDLTFSEETFQLPAAKALLEQLNRSDLKKKLHSFAGYDTTQTGQTLA